MISGKLTRKGQVTVPKAVREHLGVGEDDRLCFTPLDDGRVIISAGSRDASVAFDLLKDRPRKRKTPLTDQEIQAIIDERRLQAGLGEGE